MVLPSRMGVGSATRRGKATKPRIQRRVDPIQAAFAVVQAYVQKGGRANPGDLMGKWAACDVPLERLQPDQTCETNSEELLTHTKQILDERVESRASRAFFLHRVDGYSYEEIAEQLQISPDTVGQYIAKAMYVLTLAKHGTEPP